MKSVYRVILMGEWYSTNVRMELTESELALFKEIQERTMSEEQCLVIVPYIEDDPLYNWDHISHV